MSVEKHVEMDIAREEVVARVQDKMHELNLSQVKLGKHVFPSKSPTTGGSYLSMAFRGGIGLRPPALRSLAKALGMSEGELAPLAAKKRSSKVTQSHVGHVTIDELKGVGDAMAALGLQTISVQHMLSLVEIQRTRTVDAADR